MVEKKLRQQRKPIRQIQNMKWLCGLHEGFGDKDSKEDWHDKFQFQAEEVLWLEEMKEPGKSEDWNWAITIGKRQSHEPKTEHSQGRYDMKLSKNSKNSRPLSTPNLYK